MALIPLPLGSAPPRCVLLVCLGVALLTCNSSTNQSPAVQTPRLCDPVSTRSFSLMVWYCVKASLASCLSCQFGLYLLSTTHLLPVTSLSLALVSSYHLTTKVKKAKQSLHVKISCLFYASLFIGLTYMCLSAGLGSAVSVPQSTRHNALPHSLLMAVGLSHNNTAVGNRPTIRHVLLS